MTKEQLAIALNALFPNGPWNVKQKGDEVWWIWKGDEKDKPTEEQLQSTWDSIAHMYERKYDPLTDQMDQLWHDIDNGKLGEAAKTGAWYLSVKAVKDAIPKSE